MKKIFFVSIFVSLLQFGVFAQNQNFALGIELAKAGDFQSALPKFQNAFAKELSKKQTAQIHYNIGVCFYQLKQTNEAVIEFEKAIWLNSDYEKAFYALGMALSELKNFSKSETAFLQTIKLSNGRNGEAWFDLAFAYIGQQKYDEAFTSFQKAIISGSRATGASHNNLGVIYAIKGNFKAAEKELELANQLNFSEAVNNLQILRKAMNTKDNNLIAQLIFKEKTDER